ncbi:LL-diaminopimelate aminotransferase [Megasphaera sp. WILCCON 0056]|uniref:LL-diaminopimelate aminotransferase n=1 Tax=Megasphaera sp. WILCCON 0056 TaxID=3345340 RepID=UPI003A80CA03
MAYVNENYLKLKGNYLFAAIAKKVEAFSRENPEANIIRLGIGDVTRPIAPAVISAIHKAAEEMSHADTFRGYGPEQGYDFLRKAIIKGDYNKRGIELDLDEVFVSNGAKTDAACIQEIFSDDVKIAVTDPVYPVYLDSNIMFGHTGEWNDEKCSYDGVVYLPCSPENNFNPLPPEEKVDIVYLCNPSNPTGTAMSKTELKKWVEYAKKNKVIIIYDSAYEAYITEKNIPHSIYEIEGAKDVAIELRSYSKCAGFTGIRCSYVIVPKKCMAYKKDGTHLTLNSFWNRRQSTFTNGIPYIVQRAAEAYYTEEGYRQCQEDVAYYMKNAQIIRDGLSEAGFTVYGATNSPYAWVKTPDNMKSWDFFDLLLKNANVVTTPGSGFGPHGEGYLRLTAFGTRENTIQAIKRIRDLHLLQ